eukprot:1410223-Rhodomonas_salina.1
MSILCRRLCCVRRKLCSCKQVGDVSCGLVHSAAVPANSHAATSRVVELEEEVRGLQVRLRNAEEKVQAERKLRLMLEHKLEE